VHTICQGKFCCLSIGQKNITNEENMDEVEYKVIEIISKSLSLDKSKITLQSRIAEDLGADSVDQVEIIMELDKVFGVDISDEEAAKIFSVADAVEFIKKNIQQ